jgi:hypothetical protein
MTSSQISESGFVNFKNYPRKPEVISVLPKTEGVVSVLSVLISGSVGGVYVPSVVPSAIKKGCLSALSVSPVDRHTERRKRLTEGPLVGQS